MDFESPPGHREAVLLDGAQPRFILPITQPRQRHRCLPDVPGRLRAVPGQELLQQPGLQEDDGHGEGGGGHGLLGEDTHQN